MEQSDGDIALILAGGDEEKARQILGQIAIASASMFVAGEEMLKNIAAMQEPEKIDPGFIEELSRVATYISPEKSPCNPYERNKRFKSKKYKK